MSLRPNCSWGECVVLFFAISGFVIPYSLRKKASRGVGAASATFAIRRLFRLFPAYWVSVFAAALLWPVVGMPADGSTVLANLTMFQTAFGFADVIGLYWSLRVEVVFYALCLLLFVPALLQRPAWLAGAVAQGLFLYVSGSVLKRSVTPGTWPGTLEHFPLYALFIAVMFWGALLRWALGRGAEPLGRWTACVLFGFPVTILAVPLLLNIASHWRAVPSGQTIPHALGLLIFIVMSMRVRLQSRFAAWLGRISYSLYLFHPLVFVALLSAITQGYFPWLAHAHLGVVLATCIALSIAVAAIVFYTVEAPAIRLGRWLSAGAT